MSGSVRAQGSPLWWLAVLLLCQLPSLSATCPSFCICDQIKLAVSCVKRNLTEVPTSIPEVSKRLDFRGNSIKEIVSGSFLPLPYLTHLNMQGCAIETLQEGAFRGLGRLLYLNLASNRIAIIYQESFDGLAALQQLQLSGNRLEEIQPGSFSQLGFLNFLNLGENFLVFLPSLAFQGLQNIRWVRLSHNALSTLAEEAFAGLFTLQRLSLDHNELQFFPTETLSRLTSLTRLDLGSNPVTYLGEEAVRMPSLRQLFLDRLSLQDVSLTALDKAPKLVLLDLSFNQLRVLQPLSGPEKLQQVNLTGNPIQCNCYMRPFREWTGRARVRAEVFCAGPVPFRGERLDSLRPVDLRCQSQAEMEKAEREDRLLLPALEPTAESREQRGQCPEHCDCKADIQHSSCEGKGLQKIPKGFPSDTKLLDLRGNHFHYIPGKAFSGMGEVVSLHLQKCGIVELEPKSFSGMKKLVYLYLSQNELSQINAEAFEGAPQLSYLHLERNKFKTFPRGAFALLPSLFTLHLEHNSIGQLARGDLEGAGTVRSLYLTGNGLVSLADGCLAPVRELESLSLEDNRLEEVPSRSLGHAPLLQELRLSGNPIRWVGPDAFLPLAGSLRHLYLAGMGLEKLSSKALSGLGEGLRSLYLENNQLENVPSLTSFTSLEVINLAGNPFHCDCPLLPLRKWIEKVNLKVRATCGSPPELRGHKVKDVTVFKSCPGEKPPPRPQKNKQVKPAGVKTTGTPKTHKTLKPAAKKPKA
ncbi:chondroadherin-like b isoform X2 [Polyodon spathula]|nr:chondroadherin-like b isoform X2 [Polyodon spathula]